MTCQKEINQVAKKFVGRNISNSPNLRKCLSPPNQTIIFDAWILDRKCERKTEQDSKRKQQRTRKKKHQPLSSSQHPLFHINTAISISRSLSWGLTATLCSGQRSPRIGSLCEVRWPTPRSQTLGSSPARAPLITMTRKSIPRTSQLPREENSWRHVIQEFPLSSPPIFLTAKS